MSSRVTRSSARQAAEASRTQAEQTTARSQPASKKRKATAVAAGSPQVPSETLPASPPRRSKRQRVAAVNSDQASTSAAPPVPLAPPRPTRRAKVKTASAMSTSTTEASPNNEAPAKMTRRKAAKPKKSAPDPPAPNAAAPSTKRSKKANQGQDEDVKMTDAGSKLGPAYSHDDDDDQAELNGDGDEEDDDVAERDLDDEEEDVDDDDPFMAGYLGGSGHASSGITSTLRALSGMMSGVSSRLREILSNLQRKDDPSVRLIALQELSEVLLVSTEDNLSGHFSPDPFVKELVSLMEPDEFGEENTEMMLLACRCIANLMEALPSATANVVYGGAVPVLCQKLLEIHYIDIAEQALSTLEKISVEFPASIVREGGLTACLTYLDFFATSTQRTAVTTAANCCRNIPEDSFPVVRDVMPILLNVLNSNDQKVVEQACLCVCRIVESYRSRHPKLEELVSPELLKKITRLLLPGTTNLIGPHIHTQFLRVLAITARASARLTAELFKMSIVDTLYQILTGVSPPESDADASTELDGVLIMQALIHRPREQIVETLNVICELLPGVPAEIDLQLLDFSDVSSIVPPPARSLPATKKAASDCRSELLVGCRDELKRFAMILLPTLTDAYCSTVNRSVRQKVLMAQLKMLSNLDASILEDALRNVPYASFLASILSQQDHPSLVMAALQAAELLIQRLGDIYRYQFYREGVTAEIAKLADRASTPSAQTLSTDASATPKSEVRRRSTSESEEFVTRRGKKHQEAEDHSGNSSEGDHDDEDDDQDDDAPEDTTSSPASSQGSSFLTRRNQSTASQPITMEEHISNLAKDFVRVHEADERAKETRERAAKILNDLQTLSSDIRRHYFGNSGRNGATLFQRLANYFVGDALETITSYELLHSGVMQVLLDVLGNPKDKVRLQARATFLEVFLGTDARTDGQAYGSKTPITPFAAVIHKLQDLLSRAEHFEVITAHDTGFDSSRSNATSMLSKQLRLKLVADDDSGIPRQFRNIVVSIHAVATFKALDDYLRPRISLSERPKTSKGREGVSHALAAYAAAAGIPHPRLPERGAPPALGEASTTPSSTAPAAASTTTRLLRKSTKAKSASVAPATQPAPAPAPDKSTAPRRSSRRQQPKSQPPPPSESLDTLECADERQLVDPGDEAVEDNSALDAILGDINDNVDDSAQHEPSAVHMEVASSGKVTARKEDGTRVATPSQVSAVLTQTPPPSQLLAEQTPSTATPTLPTRHRSYAAAMQAIPQDWHLEFSLGDKALSSDTTIFRAVHGQHRTLDNISSRGVWAGIHSIKFKRVPGPPPQETSTAVSASSGKVDDDSSDLPESLSDNAVTSAILRLLNILHAINANLDDVMVEATSRLRIQAEPATQFVNTKLTAKLNRQLEEPLIVASHCLPSWSEDLARFYPFLFPFETRHLFLRSTSFGYSRSMMRWQTGRSTNDSRQDRHRDDRAFLGRLQRQKVRISRSRILDSAVKVIELYGASPSVLEVEYFEEVGTGLGPTLEFYSSVSKEFSKKKLGLWREGESHDADEYAFGKSGLFPAPMSDEQAETEGGKKILQMFRILGRFVARSMLDSRIIDISFNPTFFRIGDGPTTVSPSLGAVRTVDEGLANSLKLVKEFADAKARLDESPGLSEVQKKAMVAAIQIQGVRVEDLGLDFTLPGYPFIELQPNGFNIPVTIDNVGLYVDRVIDLTLGSGVQKQVAAFRAGFSSVFPYSALRAFTPDELVMLFGRVEEDWSIETLMDSIKADHGFNMDSKSVKNLLQTMSELSLSDRREFLQFVTGSPKLPIGGFKRLTPMFTVVCRPSEPPYTSDDYLPSVMTCVNYLKLPDYTSMEVMRERLRIAISEGQGAFHLS